MDISTAAGSLVGLITSVLGVISENSVLTLSFVAGLMFTAIAMLRKLRRV